MPTPPPRHSRNRSLPTYMYLSLTPFLNPEEWDKKFEKEVSDDSWTGLKTKTQPEVIAEQILLRHMFRENCWDKLDDAWQASLVPPGALLRHRNGYTAFSIKVFKVAFLAWPAKELAKDLWIEDISVAKLDWHVCFDIKDWSVIPTRDVCCMAAVTKDRHGSICFAGLAIDP